MRRRMFEDRWNTLYHFITMIRNEDTLCCLAQAQYPTALRYVWILYSQLEDQYQISFFLEFRVKRMFLSEQKCIISFLRLLHSYNFNKSWEITNNSNITPSLGIEEIYSFFMPGSLRKYGGNQKFGWIMMSWPM